MSAAEKDLPWLRLYTAMMDDDKVLLLSEADRWRFCALLMLKRAGVLDSTAPMRELRIARKLRIDVRELRVAMQCMIDVGLIDENWQPIAWRRRQFPEALTGAERMRRYRDRQRDEIVTAPSQEVTPSDVLDIETESEKKTESDSAPAAALESLPERKSKDTPRTVAGSPEGGTRLRAPRRATRRMPDDWLPNTEFLCWAAAECPLVDLTQELRTLRDHEFKVAHTDWDATARNWIRREQKQLARRPGNGVANRETRHQRMRRTLDEI